MGKREKQKSLSNDSLRLSMLGGVGEVGKNCAILEHGDTMIMVDGGVKFPEEEVLGVDLIIPDTSYVQENAGRLKAIIATHGHEDHIGGIPFILQQLSSPRPVPVYGSRFTLALLAERLKERKALHLAKLVEVDGDQIVPIGGLEVEFLSVSHSIPGSTAIIFNTPVGRLMYTGDWKFAEMSEKSRIRLSELGRQGVRILVSDCVRVESPGRTPPEGVVAEALDRIIAEAPGRVVISTFASNLGRMRDAISSARVRGRVVSVIGRSMQRNLAVAEDLGYVEVPPGTIVEPEQLKRVPRQQTLILASGSQGEPTSALARLALGEHRYARLESGDTVVLSATPIVGNEQTISATIDNLLRQGVDVIYPARNPAVHVSGHASRDELGDLISILQPEYCVPVHGEYRMQVEYRRLAGERGIPENRVFLVDIGDGLEFSKYSAGRGESVPAGSVLVDGLTIGALTPVVLRSRQHLAAGGILIAVVALDRHSGDLVSGPDIVTRGVPLPEDGFAQALKDRVSRALRRKAGKAELEYAEATMRIKDAISTFVYKESGLRPLILPIVTQV
ncbi:MAG: ribonuclease J [Chloroflexi bacterium]|nr:ribonuclease J [Chloroflexota bacterium]